MKIIAHKKILITIGLFIVIASIATIGTLGLNLGIDFTGGALTEVAYETRPEKSVLETELNQLNLGGYSLRETVDESGRSGYLLRTRDLSEEERVLVSETIIGSRPNAEITRFTSIGPVIGQELTEKAKWAIGGVLVVIVLYVSFAFLGGGRPVSSFVYGGITILALLHDVLVPTAVMSLLGYFYGVEVDVLFVMALLAVLGYSVNDTIVVFDRVRENLIGSREEKKKVTTDKFGQKREEITYTFNKPFAEVAGVSVDQTLLRSINTSLTTFLALLALYTFGGDVTKTFSLILMVGVVAGTYSSIFLATPLLVWWADYRSKSQT